MTLEDPPVVVMFWQVPGTTPAVRIPYFVDMLEEGMILIPQDIVLADTHLAFGS